MNLHGCGMTEPEGRERKFGHRTLDLKKILVFKEK
jgi:hypothetical protein